MSNSLQRVCHSTCSPSIADKHMQPFLAQALQGRGLQGRKRGHLSRTVRKALRGSPVMPMWRTSPSLLSSASAGSVSVTICAPPAPAQQPRPAPVSVEPEVKPPSCAPRARKYKRAV